MRPVPDHGLGEGLHERVARTARARPGAIALVENDRRTTYRDLDRTADSWAAGLAAAGAGPGTFVPILLPRSTRLVVALLAVLKTGAAYALLDPGWPARRVRETFADLRPPLQITDAGLAGGLPVWTPPERPLQAFEPVSVPGTHPCCVFFTSGTTGRPKGVVSPHRATARLFPPDGFARFDSGTVMPLAAALPWDAFSLELWSVLLNGGTSVIIGDEPYLTAEALREGVRRHGVNTVWLTASLFNMIVDEDPGAFAGTRQVLIGGERLSTGHVAAFLRGHPGITLVNGYGPVESTVFATAHPITPADCARPSGIPLGRPVPGTGVHVLDGGRLCAPGETGEIHVSGAGLALSYLEDPALTEDRFTRVQIGGGPVRVYRTGDLGHRDASGLLHYSGRADRQIKIRGNRVEPAEVERQIEDLLPDVRACRVVTRRDESGAARELLAVCVPMRAADPLTGALPRLRAELAAHHTPSAVVSVGEFPVTAVGKLDEAALLAMADQAAPPQHAEENATTTKQDPMARTVAAAFAEVLERPAVPHDVPFVELGGSSLAAGRVCARLTTRLSRSVPLSRLYEHPTVAQLSAWLRTRDATPAPQAAASPAAGVPLTPTQLTFLARRLLDPADLTGTCLLSWEIEGDLDRAALGAALAEVQQRHEALSAIYVLEPRPIVVLDDVPPPELEVLPAAPTVGAACHAARSELLDGLAPEAGMVWRSVLVPVTARRSVLTCAVHHVAFDGWSETVLAQSIAAAYDRARGERPHAPAPATSLAEADHARRARLAQADLPAQHERLVQELTGLPTLEWPTADSGGGIGRAETHLGPDVVSRLRALARRTGTSLFSLLLSAWARSLAEVTGHDDFAAGVPVAQRDSPALEQALGCHITMLCLRLRGAALDEQAPLAAARKTAATVERALANQDVPLTDVLETLNDHEPPRSSLYRTLFALQDNAAPELPLRGLRTDFVRQPYADLPLDLHTELWPTEEGGLRVEVSHRRGTVADRTAHDLLKGSVERLLVLGEM